MSTSAEPPEPPSSMLVATADEVAGEAASFVAAVESVAAGANPGAAVSVLILALSGVLVTGARLGAQEDAVYSADELHLSIRRAVALGEEQDTGRLRRELAEQFGGVDEYQEVIDPYVGEDLDTARISDDLATVAGDLLQGLALYTDGRIEEALAWWQYSYLARWGPAASACLRAVQSLLAMVRLGAPMGAPGEDLPPA